MEPLTMSTVLNAAHAVLAQLWPWLPQCTLALRFATALISFWLSAGLLIRRLRRWAHRRRAAQR